ncbi:MAG: SH3 domain-containing protein [Clostridia bacterium]|nr:SH3 domain-containing protein [Clostridia bacterium]
MKHLAKFMAVLLVLLTCMSAVTALAETKVTTTANVNLRTGPGVEYRSLGIVYNGKTVTVSESAKATNGVYWYHVTNNGTTGWICSTYTKTASSGSTSGTVTTTGSVNLRSGGGLTYGSLRTIPKGVSLTYDSTTIDGRGVKWYHVTYKGTTGWVSSKYATPGGSGSGSSSSTNKKVKTTGSVNLRSGAGLGFQTLRTVPKNVTLTFDDSAVDSRGVTWYHVTYKSKSGWISSKYAKKV